MYMAGSMSWELSIWTSSMAISCMHLCEGKRRMKSPETKTETTAPTNVEFELSRKSDFTSELLDSFAASYLRILAKNLPKGLDIGQNNVLG